MSTKTPKPPTPVVAIRVTVGTLVVETEIPGPLVLLQAAK